MDSAIAIERLDDRTLLTAYVVNTLSDTVAADGLVSLREAIQAANTNAAINEAAAGQSGVTDSITFAAGLSGGTITLAGGTLHVSDGLTIRGLGASLLTIGGDRCRVFQSSGDVEISGVKIADGYVENDSGGGISNAGTLTLTHCIVSDNRAQQSQDAPTFGGGGGIQNGGTMRLINCVVSHNYARFPLEFVGIGGWGGGIWNSGTLTLTNCVVSENDGRAGGGIDNWSTGVLTLANCTVSGNRSWGGGGISNSGMLTVTNSALSDNQGFAGSGGIENSGTLSLANSTISGNSGGGISSDSLGTLTLTNCTISGNSNGGGVYSEGTLAITNSTISGNSASRSGGGIYVSANGTATLRNTTVVGNIADSDANAIGFGGGIAFEGGGAGSVTLHNTLVAGNSQLLRVSPFPLSAADDIRGTLAAGSSFNLIGDAGTAGGLSNGTNGNIVGVNWETVFDPVLRDNGGPTLTHALLAGGRAIDAGNNGEAVGPSGIPLMTDQRGLPRISGGRADIGSYEAISSGVVDILDDEEDSNYGVGDLSLREAAKITAPGGTVSFAAALRGGTVRLTAGAIDLAGNVTVAGLGATQIAVSGNNSSRVFSVHPGATVQIRGLAVTGGRADLGGGINNEGALTLADCVITGNTAEFVGGGIRSVGTLVLTNCTVSGNRAVRIGGGGGVYSEGTFTARDSVFIGNSANPCGGGIMNAGALSLTDCTLANNNAAQSGGGLYGSGAAALATLMNVTVAGTPPARTAAGSPICTRP